MHVPGLTEHGTIAFASSAMEAMPVITDDTSTMHRKQKLLKAMALMDCEDGYECSVRKLPHIDIRHQVQYASDLDATSTQRIFRRDIKAWAHMLLPDLILKCISRSHSASNRLQPPWKTPPWQTRAMMSFEVLPVPSFNIPILKI